jgi:hypothetical protein
MVYRLDEGMLLRQGPNSPKPSGTKKCACSALAYERTGLSNRAPIDCPDTYVGDVAFVKAHGTIGHYKKFDLL